MEWINQDNFCFNIFHYLILILSCQAKLAFSKSFLFFFFYYFFFCIVLVQPDFLLAIAFEVSVTLLFVKIV
jgi:hypothetical protein